MDTLSLTTLGLWEEDVVVLDSLGTSSLGLFTEGVDTTTTTTTTLPPVIEEPEIRPPSGISKGKGGIEFPQDGFIQIFVQKGLTKTKIE